MNTAYKIIMVVVGCVVAYFLMSLATNSQKMSQGITVNAGLTKRIQNIENQVSSILNELNEADSRLDINEKSVTKVEASIQNLSEIKNKISIIEDKVQDSKLNVAGINNNELIAQIAKLDGITESLKSDNKLIREELDKKNNEISTLKSKLDQNNALIEALDCSDAAELDKKLEVLMASASKMGVDAYKRMQVEVETLLVKVDGMKETLAAYKVAGVDKVKDLNDELNARIDDLKQMLSDSKEYTKKEIENIENNYEKFEKNFLQRIAQVEKELDNSISPNVDIIVQQVKDKVSVEIENIKREFSGLQKNVTKLVSKENETQTEPIGIVVNKVFDKSLVMINTSNGTFVFNPYADFTGVIRVRDAGGNEKMVLVPYTGEYLKIGENIIDTGPFARNCVLGINCNIDVRGSMNAPVTK